jgi:hypothetical protein
MPCGPYSIAIPVMPVASRSFALIYVANPLLFYLKMMIVWLHATKKPKPSTFPTSNLISK